MALQCGQCGKHGRYDVRTVTVSPRALERANRKRPPDEFIGFTGYVRCRHCDSGGPWHFPDRTMTEILHMMILKLERDEEVGLEIVETQTFDGHKFRYPTQSEAHLKSLIEQEPGRAYLWTRLGNLYTHGGRLDLSEPAYHRALELDPRDIEAHSMWATNLENSGRHEAAIAHWQAVLAYARDATHVREDLRRGCVREAVEAILRANATLDRDVPFYPPDYQPHVQPTDQKEVVLELREFDLSKTEDFEALCDGFLGKPQRRRRIDRLNRAAERAEYEDRLEPVRAEARTRRNDPCPCGSGRKFKKCCGRPMM
jgi:tetratricopeptide (TPR) repeat protein